MGRLWDGAFPCLLGHWYWQTTDFSKQLQYVFSKVLRLQKCCLYSSLRYLDLVHAGKVYFEDSWWLFLTQVPSGRGNCWLSTSILLPASWHLILSTGLDLTVHRDHHLLNLDTSMQDGSKIMLRSWYDRVLLQGVLINLSCVAVSPVSWREKSGEVFVSPYMLSKSMCLCMVSPGKSGLWFGSGAVEHFVGVHFDNLSSFQISWRCD